MPYAHVRGIDLYFEEHGEGPPLIFAHGLMGSIELSRHFGERIDAIAARGVRVIAYDARGHGRSGYTGSRDDYAWTSLAEDMLGLMHAVGIERASIYGGSMGAGAALMLALEHPGAVDKLILRAPPPFGRHAAEAKRLFGGLAVMYQFLGPRITARMLMRFPQVQEVQRTMPHFSLEQFFAGQRRAAIVPAIHGILEGDPFPIHRLAEIAHPTLILTHPGDAIHPESSGELLHDRMPHARLAMAPTATYWQENPEALEHVVSAFVRDEPIARGLPEKRAHDHAAAPDAAAQ